MIKRLLIALATLSLALGLAGVSTPGNASAAPGCADVHLVFARGTQEAGGFVGTTGQGFYRSLQARFPGKSVKVSPVRYEASGAFEEGVNFLKTVAVGVRDAQGQIRYLSDKCPKSRIVIGGYSQGAVVATYAVSDQVDAASVVVSEVPAALSGKYARHVAGVIRFGGPADRWFNELGLPAPRVGKAYVRKSRSYCIPGDNICDGGPLNRPNTVHGNYVRNGLTDRAANFVARFVR